MKRLFYLIFMTLCATNLLAQKIYVDRYEIDGAHQIMTKAKEYSIEGKKYDFGLKLFETKDEDSWLLIVSSYNDIPKTSKILLRLGNEQVIYLPVNNVIVDNIPKSKKHRSKAKAAIAKNPKQYLKYYSSVYELTERDIIRIEKYGIEKIRISNGAEYLDKSFSNNSLGKYLTKSSKVIIQKMKNPHTLKGLYEDF